MGLVHDHAHWRDFVVAVLNLMFPLPENYFIANTNVTATLYGRELNVNGSELCPTRDFVLAVLNRRDRYIAGPTVGSVAGLSWKIEAIF